MLLSLKEHVSHHFTRILFMKDSHLCACNGTYINNHKSNCQDKVGSAAPLTKSPRKNVTVTSLSQGPRNNKS